MRRKARRTRKKSSTTTSDGSRTRRSNTTSTLQPGRGSVREEWGMKVAVEDLHRVIESAHKLGGAVVLGGHSLGGSVVTAYATWDFGGKPGADGLSGLVYDDGGSGITPVSEEKAKEELKKLEESSPWLSFGGISAPFAGLFVVTGAAGDADRAERTLPRGGIPAGAGGTEAAVQGQRTKRSSDSASTSKRRRKRSIAAQAHVGHLVKPPNPEEECTWSGEGALTPIHRYAEMFYGQGILGEDGAEWYFPAAAHDRHERNRGGQRKPRAEGAGRAKRRRATTCRRTSRSLRSTANSTRSSSRPGRR